MDNNSSFIPDVIEQASDAVQKNLPDGAEIISSIDMKFNRFEEPSYDLFSI